MPAVSSDQLDGKMAPTERVMTADNRKSCCTAHCHLLKLTTANVKLRVKNSWVCLEQADLKSWVRLSELLPAYMMIVPGSMIDSFISLWGNTMEPFKNTSGLTCTSSPMTDLNSTLVHLPKLEPQPTMLSATLA